MVKMFLSLYDSLAGKKGLLVLILVLLMAICGVSLSTMEYKEDIAEFLPIDRKVSTQADFMEKLSDQDKVAVLFYGKGTDDESVSEIIYAMDLFEETWLESDTAGLVPGISAMTDETAVAELIGFVQDNIASFLTVSDYDRMDSLLSTPGYMDMCLEQDKRSLQSFAGQFTRMTIPADPLNLFSGVLSQLVDLGNSSGYNVVDGHIIHSTQPVGVLFFDSPFGNSESGRNADIVRMVNLVSDQVMAQTDIRVSATGAPLIAVANADRIKRDSVLAVLLAVIGIIVVLWISFRRLGDMLWIAVSLLFGMVFALGCIGLFKDSISIIVIGLGSIIVGIAANYPLHFLHSLRETGNNRRTLQEMVIPLLVGNITTVSAFLCLIFLKAQAMHDLALFGSFMLAGTILFTLVFLPVLVKPARVERESEEEIAASGKRGKIYVKVVSWAVMLITAVMLIWGNGAKFDTDLSHINYMTDSQRNDLELLSQGVDINGAGQLSVIASMIPQASQQENLEGKWESFWKEHSYALTELETKMQEHGFRKGAFDQFLMSARSEQKLVSREELQGESMSEVIASLVQSLSEDFNMVLFMCGFIVFVFLWISFGSLELALISFLPLTVGWVWILSIMNMLGIQFNIVSIILATFIFGQGDDYTIFITEGLMQEYAQGRRILKDRLASVIISAVIMFIGIGTLIFAKHPAMKSLAEITILGMMIVVVMAGLLPTWLFRNITTKKGEVRAVPVTLKRIAYSVISLLALLVAVIVVTPLALLIFIGPRKEWKDRWLHGVIYRFAGFCIKRVPGTVFTLDNSVGETFHKPALIISNHQSHLDLMCILMLTPKIVVVTNEWVWKNPIYGPLIRRAEYIPVADGLGDQIDHMRDLVRRGYSILVFPEGSRSADLSINRFHKGAFMVAQELGLDILPICLHGVGQVLPKTDFMLREGRMTVTVGKRMPARSGDYGSDLLEQARWFRHYYQQWYGELCSRLEDAGYWKPYVEHQFIYKGIQVLRDMRYTFRTDSWKEAANAPHVQDGTVTLMNQGMGELALLTALVHPELRILDIHTNPEQFAVANAIAHKPSNLEVIYEEEK